MEKRYKEILLTNEYGKLLEARKKGIPAVPCLPVIYAGNPITAGKEKLTAKEMDLSGYSYVLEHMEA